MVSNFASVSSFEMDDPHKLSVICIAALVFTGTFEVQLIIAEIDDGSLPLLAPLNRYFPVNRCQARESPNVSPALSAQSQELGSDGIFPRELFRLIFSL